MRRLYHYTTRERLEFILHDGEIKQTSDLVAANEKPVVWFSFHPDWEATATKWIGMPDGSVTRGTKESTHVVGGGLVRIAVKPASVPIDWTQYKKLSGIDTDNVKSLTNAAFECDMSPRDWRCSFEPVTSDNWLSIEYWNGESWTEQPG